MVILEEHQFWIAVHETQLDIIQSMSPVIGALAFSELADEFYDKFNLDLYTELEKYYGTDETM